MPSSAAFSDDLLGREQFASKFERFLLTEHHFVDGALVLTLNAPFGAGKTTYVRMWTDDLRNRKSSDTTLPRAVILNAWETDFCGDPLVAIVAALKESLIDGPDPKPELAKKLTDAVKDVGWFALGVTGGIVGKATGVDAFKAGDLAEKKSNERAQAAEFFAKDLIEMFDQRKTALTKIKGALAEAFHDDEARAVVVIDELDRCRPDYAVSYLETIKHVFDVHGMVFVLCVDEQQLASAASVLFGTQLSFDEYYRKFSHRTVRLPEPSQDELERLSAAYVKRYLAREGKRWSALQLRDGPVESIPEIFSGLKMRPRQAQEAFRVIGHAFAKKTDDGRGTNWMWGTMFVLMSALRVARPDTYARLASPEARPADATKVAREILGNTRNPTFWFELLVSSLRRDEKWEVETAEQLKLWGKGDASADKVDVQRILGDYLRWNHSSNTSMAKSVSEWIESIASFSER